MASEVDIINSAMNMIGASNIIARDEDSKAARVSNQRYDSIRDAVLRAHPWNCAVTRRSLAPDSETVAFDWDYQFTLPADPYCLRVLRLDYLDIEFRVEGRKIVTNEQSRNLIYIARGPDPHPYDTLLQEAIAARLAADVSFTLSQSTSLTQNMYSLYESKLKEARFVDATEGTPGAVLGVAASGALQADYFTDARL